MTVNSAEEVSRETIDFLNSNKEEINKLAYDGNASAMTVVRAYNLHRAGRNRSTRIILEGSVDAFKRVYAKFREATEE